MNKNSQAVNTMKVTNQKHGAPRSNLNSLRYLKVTRDFMCFLLAIICITYLVPTDDGRNGGIIGSIIQTVSAQSCPKFGCNDDQSMADSGTCFQHTANDPVTEIKVQKCDNSSTKCIVPEGRFAWVQSDLQFKSQAERIASGLLESSQLYGKIFKQECVATESLEKDLNNGRKCTYAYQCKSRVCDTEGTGACVGREEGETCSMHEQCHKQLACRPNNIWPFETICLPLAEVGSECESEFDCKPRNFCWKIKADDPNYKSICLEKFSAPDFTEFMWDVEKYPVMTKEAILHHGQYCRSGTASMKLKENNGKLEIPNKNDPEAKIAVCISVDDTFGYTSDPDDLEGTSLSAPYSCSPDGKTYCLYKKGGQTYFKLLCECGLSEDGNSGYCPIPGQTELLARNHYLHKMWIGDNCHTLDRHKFIAQLECGIGTNFGTLANATNNTFTVNYYPYIQGEKNFECMEQFIPDSKWNVLAEKSRLMKVQMTKIITVALFTYFIAY